MHIYNKIADTTAIHISELF